MPVDYYIGRSVEDLERMLRGLQDRKAKGAVTEVSAAGVRTVKSFSGQDSVEKEIFNVRYSLFLRSEGNHPNPQKERITRVRTRYL